MEKRVIIKLLILLAVPAETWLGMLISMMPSRVLPHSSPLTFSMHAALIVKEMQRSPDHGAAYSRVE